MTERSNTALQDSDEVTIDLGRMAEIAGKMWPKLFLILLVFSAAAYFGTVMLIPKEYTASSKIVIVAKNDNSNQTISYTEVQTAQKLTSTYTQIMQSEAISDIVIKDLSLDQKGYTNKTYNSVVKITSEDNTEVMNISATTRDPQLSADLANDVVNVFKSKIYDIMQIENVTVLNTAKVPQTPSGPSVTKNTAIGALIGLLLDFLWVFLRTLHDTKLKTEEEVKDVLGYPVIGIIPEMKMSNKKEEVDLR